MTNTFLKLVDLNSRQLPTASRAALACWCLSSVRVKGKRVGDCFLWVGPARVSRWPRRVVDVCCW